MEQKTDNRSNTTVPNLNDSTLVRQALLDLKFIKRHTKRLSIFAASTKKRRQLGIKFIEEAITKAREKDDDGELLLTYRIVSEMASGILDTEDPYRTRLRKTLEKTSQGAIVLRLSNSFTQREISLTTANSPWAESNVSNIKNIDELEEENNDLKAENESLISEIDILQKSESNLSKDLGQTKLVIYCISDYLKKSNLTLPKNLACCVQHIVQAPPSNNSFKSQINYPQPSYQSNPIINKKQSLIFEETTRRLEIATITESKHSQEFEKSDKEKLTNLRQPLSQYKKPTQNPELLTTNDTTPKAP